MKNSVQTMIMRVFGYGANRFGIAAFTLSLDGH